MEIRNQADQLVYSTEKSMKELGDKLDPQDKEFIENSLADLKKTLEGGDVEMIKTATERLTEVSYKAFGKVYQQQAQQQQAQQAGGADPGQQSYEQPPQDDVVDADYEVVDDDK